MAKDYDFDKEVDWKGLEKYSQLLAQERNELEKSNNARNAWIAGLDDEKKELYELQEAYKDFLKSRKEGKILSAEEKEELEERLKALDLYKGKIDKVSSALTGVLSKAFKEVSSIVKSSLQVSEQYFQSLNSIVGISGRLGEVGAALKSSASGVVGRSDLAAFFGSTGSMMGGADAIKQQVGYARDLIAAYGSVNVAVSKYQQIMMLSVEDQKIALATAEKMAKAVEGSAAGQIKALQTQMSDAMADIGQSILYTVKPILEFLSQVAQAFKEVSGLSRLDDQTTAMENFEATMTEEERRVQDLLAEMERLNSTGFTSSLDEIHAIGSYYVEADPQTDAENTEDAERTKQEAISQTSEKAMKFAEVLKEIFDIVGLVSESFATLFETVGPPLLNLISGILQVVAGLVQWLDKTNLLIPVISALIGILVAAKIAQLGFAVATMVTQIAAAGFAAPIKAAAIVGGIAIGVGALAALGSGIAMGGSSGSSVSTPTNNYDGTQQEIKQAPVNIYLDGKKVNDGLANAKYYEEEVVIG